MTPPRGTTATRRWTTTHPMPPSAPATTRPPPHSPTTTPTAAGGSNDRPPARPHRHRTPRVRRRRHLRRLRPDAHVGAHRARARRGGVVSRPKLLDLFACEGGASVGYDR